LLVGLCFAAAPCPARIFDPRLNGALNPEYRRHV
jgi:hypothetical protein